jgi:glucosyl-dolichyl phosphate glucuronosyltransferase
MRTIQLTVLMATRNGEHVLPRTLESYRRIVAPAVGWKIVIVDNGSTDSTPKIIESFKKDLPLEILQQPISGKNRALNSGIAAVEGHLVVLTDDDAIPDPSFLQAWAKFLESRGDYELFGGLIEPLFETAPEKWLIETRMHFALMFSERNLPEGPTDADGIYGPNMAVRMSIFDSGFRFDEILGPNALDPDYPMGGETEFCRRVAESGAGCWFAREPLVEHIVRAERLTESAWAQRAYRCGLGRAYQMWKRGQIVAPPSPSLIQRLAMLSPVAEHRFKSLPVYHLARGFRDECKRREAKTAH